MLPTLCLHTWRGVRLSRLFLLRDVGLHHLQRHVAAVPLSGGTESDKPNGDRHRPFSPAYRPPFVYGREFNWVRLQPVNVCRVSLVSLSRCGLTRSQAAGSTDTSGAVGALQRLRAMTEEACRVLSAAYCTRRDLGRPYGESP